MEDDSVRGADLLAGLQGIPDEVLKAARVDGARPARVFLSITLPLLRPALLLALLFRTLDAFRVFDAIYVLTEGGPANSTETLSIYAFKTLMRSGDFGYGSALRWPPSPAWSAWACSSFACWGRANEARPGAALLPRPALLAGAHLALARGGDDAALAARAHLRQLRRPGRLVRARGLNSVLVAAGTTALCLAVGASAAFAIAKLDFPGRSLLLAAALAISMFPPIATVSPLYLVLRAAGLRDSLPGLLLPYSTFALPLTLWLLTSWFRELPDDLWRAARVDGCTPWQAFVHVYLPLSTPALATTAILVFIFSWNELLYALSFISRPPSAPSRWPSALRRGAPGTVGADRGGIGGGHASAWRCSPSSSSVASSAASRPER